MRAPFCAFSIVMFVTDTFATMSVSDAYYMPVSHFSVLLEMSGMRGGEGHAWPRLPTEMPCEPLHHMFATTMLVLFGLNADGGGSIRVLEREEDINNSNFVEAIVDSLIRMMELSITKRV